MRHTLNLRKLGYRLLAAWTEGPLPHTVWHKSLTHQLKKTFILHIRASHTSAGEITVKLDETHTQNGQT